MDRKQKLDQAQQYANWSIAGILVPIIGVVLSILSLTTLNSLKPFKDAEQDNAMRIQNAADISLRVSGFLVVIAIIAGVVMGVNYVQQQNRLNEATQQYLRELQSNAR